MSLAELPDEIVSHMLRFVPQVTLFDKFIEVDRLQNASRFQILILQYVTELLVVRKSSHDLFSYNPLVVFYSKASLGRAVTFKTFEEGYPILKNLFFLSIEHNVNLLRHTALQFHVGKDEDIASELDFFIRTLELFNFSNFKDEITISVQVVFDAIPTNESARFFRLMEQLMTVSGRITKLLIQNRFHLDRPIITMPQLHHAHFEGLTELRIYNNHISDESIRRYRLLSQITSLKVLDFAANTITDLTEFPFPRNLRELYLNANVIETLDNVAFGVCPHLEHLAVSLNRLESLEGVQFPAALRIFSCSFNLLSGVSNVSFPPNLEELSLANNSIKSLNNAFLPSTLKKLFLGSNQLSSLGDQLRNCTQLLVLHLNDNQFDDFDELGVLPQTLEELVLDNNPVDYTILNNILTPRLKVLTLFGCGLMSITNVQFPETLVHLNLGGNELSELANVKFGGAQLKRLMLNGSDLRSFKFDKDRISITGELEELDLSDNPIRSFGDVDLPEKLETLNISGWELSSLDIDTKRLPKNLQVLTMNDCLDRYESWEGHTAELDLSELTQFERLHAENNQVSFSIKRN